MNSRYLLTILILLLTLSVSAQKRKKAPVLTPEQQEHLEKMEQMRAATAKVTFIDSIVVDKEGFLQYYNLNPECGSLKTYGEYFKSKKNKDCFVHIPEIDKVCYYSQINSDSIINLYFSERLGNKWTRPSRIPGVNDGKRFKRSNYPFMMGDGQTLYFAADGKEGIGGYDIYVTRYNAETGRYLSPENIGMPFNSEANDYMYAIDEYDSLGWFATDRNQAEGKVCIYTFIPSPIRQMYNADEYTPEQIKGFADLSEIAKTWDDSLAVEAALDRLRMTKLRKNKSRTGREFTFIINDDVTYTHLSDFKDPNNSGRYRQLMALNEHLRKINNVLEKARDAYTDADKEEKEDLEDGILASEKRCLELKEEIRLLEKAIRNYEIICLTKKR